MAVWIPKYNSELVEPLITNLLTYIKAHIADALLWANGGTDPLAAPAATSIYNSTIGMGQAAFPDLMVWKVTTPTLDEAADESELTELHHVTFRFGVVGSDVTELTVRRWRYMKAYDSVCRSIPNASLYAGMVGTKHGAIEVISHDYGSFAKYKDDDYLLEGMFTVAIAMKESRNNSYV